jgi:hypothetical protein
MGRHSTPFPLVVLANEPTLGCGILDSPEDHGYDFRLVWLALGIGVAVQVVFEGRPKASVPRMRVGYFASTECMVFR